MLNEFKYEKWDFAINRGRESEYMTLVQQEKYFEEMASLVMDIKVKPRYTLKTPDTLLMGIHSKREITILFTLNKDGDEISPWFYFGENNNFVHMKNGYSFIIYKIVNAEEIETRVIEILTSAGLI